LRRLDRSDGLVHWLKIATRNVKDSKPMGVELCNPWEDAEPGNVSRKASGTPDTLFAPAHRLQMSALSRRVEIGAPE
jgi:hypothetical protein